MPLDLLQFHGDESAAECETWQRPYIKALRVKAGDDIAAACGQLAGEVQDRTDVSGRRAKTIRIHA